MYLFIRRLPRMTADTAMTALPGPEKTSECCIEHLGEGE